MIVFRLIRKRVIILVVKLWYIKHSGVSRTSHLALHYGGNLLQHTTEQG